MSTMRQFACAIVLHLRAFGYQALFAGGCVRDELLKRSPKDYDVATDAKPDDVERIFSADALSAAGWSYHNTHTIPVGKSFGVIVIVCGDLQVEVATLRNDGEYSDGRRPESVSFVSSFKDDAARRDFTFNAMFGCPVSGEIYDFFNGEADLKAGVIRAVGDAAARINEDKLRMMRALRFAARYGFTIDPAMLAAIKDNAHHITMVSVERLRDEIEGLLGTDHPLVGLDLLMETGLMAEILPEMMDMNGELGDQDPRWHPEGNAWVHTKMVVNNLAGSHFVLMFAGLLHDIGKPKTQKRWTDGGISNHEHDKVGAEMARDICTRFKLSNEETDRVCELVRLHMFMHVVHELRLGKLVNLLKRPDIADLIAIQHADALGTGQPDRDSHTLKAFLEGKLVELQNQVTAKPLVEGELLIRMGFKPSPDFKILKEAAMLAQNEGAFSNVEEAEAWVKANEEQLLEEVRQRRLERTYFHVGRQPNLKKIKPTKFDIHGRMPEPAVFITNQANLTYWTAFIRDAGTQPLYLYQITVSEELVIEEGPDGEKYGDWKVLTRNAIDCTFLREV